MPNPPVLLGVPQTRESGVARTPLILAAPSRPAELNTSDMTEEELFELQQYQEMLRRRRNMQDMKQDLELQDRRDALMKDARNAKRQENFILGRKQNDMQRRQENFAQGRRNNERAASNPPSINLANYSR